MLGVMRLPVALNQPEPWKGDSHSSFLQHALTAPGLPGRHKACAVTLQGRAASQCLTLGRARPPRPRVQPGGVWRWRVKRTAYLAYR